MGTFLCRLLEYLEKNECVKIHNIFSNEADGMVYVIEDAADSIQIEFTPEIFTLRILNQMDDFREEYILTPSWEFDEKEYDDWLCAFDTENEG